MYYFYRMHHKQSNVQCLAITSYNPLSQNDFIGSKKQWIKHLKSYNPSVKRLNDLAKDITITVMHESPDLNVIKQWREYYYKCWSVYNNPKFIDYYIKQECEKNRLKNRATSKQGQHLKNRSLVREYKLKWYNDGYSKNIYVKEGTAPKHYKAGRIMFGRKHSDSTKTKISACQGRKVISATGKVFKSLTEAAKAYKVTRSAINLKIRRNKHTDRGWRYA